MERRCFRRRTWTNPHRLPPNPDTIDAVARIDSDPHTEWFVTHSVDRYRKPLACGIWQCPFDSLWVERVERRCQRYGHTTSAWGPYARDSSDSERWDSLGMEISLVIHGKNGSPHSGHGKPGRNAPGICPQLRQIEEVISPIRGPLQPFSHFIIHQVDADSKWSALCSAYSGE